MMGLDQYIYKTERKDVGYFRKVNFLQGYFERKEGDDINCKYIPFTKEDFNVIMDSCLQIMEHVTYEKDNTEEEPKITFTPKAVELAKELLPVQGGFFYGSYEYDEYYFYDIKYVYDSLNKLKEEYDLNTDEFEYSCWY